ncbi:MAG TPA: UvrD-helicase domain-containing protein [Terracidiphilus sp.]|nr:UvrD-helicase domain-containing protein [Terracidiphilus sp.]
MSNTEPKTPAPDQAERDRAVDTTLSVLVRAPAGSGKTTLLAGRFLHLLAEVDNPEQVVAITFTNAAAAEMRNRILDELRTDKPSDVARRVLARSQERKWDLLDLPAQLRISTIDAFCRELALQRPLISSLGGGLHIADQPKEMYRKAARRTLNAIGGDDADLRSAIEALLLWRDNNWQDIESQLVEMLDKRERWMREFVLAHDADWETLRERLERPFGRGEDLTEPATRYSDQEWEIVRACFTVLKRAAAELQVVFSETGTADYTEVAQIAANALKGEEGIPSEGTLAAADNIRHLLVDEFQDASRKQHRLLQSLIAAWPDREGRTCFVVGDPMQSIYLFREADAELFGRVERLGLEIEGDLPLQFDTVQLSANFRTEPGLVNTLNRAFEDVFRVDDGSGVTFSRAEAARGEGHPAWAGVQRPRMELHSKFVPASKGGKKSSEERERVKEERAAAQEKQSEEIVGLIEAHCVRIEATRRSNAGKPPQDREKYRVAVLGRTKKALAGVAAGLRKAGIRFRAVDLEQLKDRPEVMDALALGRALMNGEDRVAWLGVLRAPWCGLALEDLHVLTSGDDEELIRRPVPELMKDRAELMSADGRARVGRLLRALEAGPALRFARPATQLGTWLEQAWLRVGGAACVDATERANLDLLWQTLDALPEGEQDFMGPALDAALEKLHATPDPGADSDCGVQLMTIHGSKGLEFEVVIVPELQAGTWKGEQKMLSWMERGVLDPEEAEEPTDLLVAPFQAKGAERGKAKAWVDRMQHERERQEMRRILYVAATRAREELHLFARPEYKQGDDGYELAEPRESLLWTAWPAFKPQIERQFSSWKLEQAEVAEEVVELAAQAAEIHEMPRPASTKIGGVTKGPRRLPSDWSTPEGEGAGLLTEAPIAGLGRLYERHEGGLESRALGRAVHELLQHAAVERKSRTWDEVQTALKALRPRVTAEVRAAGVESGEAMRIAERAIAIAIEATKDEAGRWILEPREAADSEVRWAGVTKGAVRTVQADRVFRAGEKPLSERGEVWWIVDYKTAQQDGVELADLRPFFAPQLETYARVLRNLRGEDVKMCAGLYYPRMRMLDWWEA